MSSELAEKVDEQETRNFRRRGDLRYLTAKSIYAMGMKDDAMALLDYDAVKEKQA